MSLPLSGLDVGRVSQLPFHWRAIDHLDPYAPDDASPHAIARAYSGQPMTFRRNGGATDYAWGFDRNGCVVRFGMHEPRISHYDIDGDGVAETAAYTPHWKGKQLVPSWDLSDNVTYWSRTAEVASVTVHRTIGEAAIYRITPTTPTVTAGAVIWSTLLPMASGASKVPVYTGLVEWNPLAGAAGDGAYSQMMTLHHGASGTHLCFAQVAWSTSGTPTGTVVGGGATRIELRRVAGNAWRYYILGLATTQTTGLAVYLYAYGSPSSRNDEVFFGMPSVVECPDVPENFIDLCESVVPPGQTTGYDTLTASADFDVPDACTLYTETVVLPFQQAGYAVSACAHACIGGYATGSVSHYGAVAITHVLYNGAGVPATIGSVFTSPDAARPTVVSASTQYRNLRTAPERRTFDAANPNGTAWTALGIAGLTAWGAGGIAIGALTGQGAYQKGSGVLCVKFASALLSWDEIRRIS
ncbi:MAG TPA: hypothetical protein VEA99_08270 [Gemmatimonadaceae bacterium]|nr:hypothetical protein [Gemmatimonadaceae bacterium]